MFNYSKFLILCLLSIFAQVHGQGKLSPKFSNSGYRIVVGTRLSISVKDSLAFQIQYKEQVKFSGRHSAHNCFQVTAIDEAIIEKMRRDPNVIFIDGHRTPVEESTLDYINTSFNRITKVHGAFPGLRGANQKVSIKEQAFDVADIDLIHRAFTTLTTPSTISQHATTMAIIAGGAGNSSSHSLGVAPAIQLTASDFNNLFPDAISIFTSNEIRVQNHSYGVGIENYYGNEAFAYDQQVSQNPWMLHVFSAGNLGAIRPSSGAYQNLPFANLSGTFKQAKNTLVVNAVDSTLEINALNSRGPAYDGRLKPELTAYGQGGTSEAAALASGSATLVQENYYSHELEYPDASMVKAILISSSNDIGPAGIDYLYGYGSLNTYKALQLVGANQYKSVVLGPNDLASIPIDITNPATKLTVAVVWADPPASPNAAKSLINDIDCELDNGAFTYRPWVLSKYPLTDSLTAAPQRKQDHQNNVEFITIDNPVPGTYNLKVGSGNLSGGSQKVSVAWSIDDDIEFNWDYPIATDVVEGGKPSLLVWDSHSQTGDLSVQYGSGTWQLIKAAVDLNKAFRWTPLDTLVKARLKMTIAGNDFLSDPFLISPLIKMHTAFDCSDSIAVSWNGSPDPDLYRLYTIGNEYLTLLSTTTDTIKTFARPAPTYYAVAPVLDGEEGIKSELVNYTLQGAACFVNAFSASRLGSSHIKVQLSLSTIYNIDHVTIYKTVNLQRKIFKIFAPEKQLDYDFNDTELLPGTMTYQAELSLKNAAKILTQTASVNIENKGKAILYPNPVTDASDLNILTEGTGQGFRILNAMGQVVYETVLDKVEGAVDLVNLPAGMYIYQLFNGNSMTDSGRFVKF
jgi:hypothetical protein